MPIHDSDDIVVEYNVSLFNFELIYLYSKDMQYRSQTSTSARKIKFYFLTSMILHSKVLDKFVAENSYSHLNHS